MIDDQEREAMPSPKSMQMSSVKIAKAKVENGGAEIFNRAAHRRTSQGSWSATLRSLSLFHLHPSDI
jgi:hypothetical protein